MNTMEPSTPDSEAPAKPADKADQHATGALPPLLYDSSDLCHILRCSKATLHRLKSGNKLPKALRLGGQLRWSVEEVQAWIRAGLPNARIWEAIKSADRKPAR
jgi:predicted DNA-binding transcriptional regulator AlpA